MALSRVIGELEMAGIRFWQSQTETHTAFGLGMPRPRTEIHVMETDLEATRALVAPIEESLPFEVTRGAGVDLSSNESRAAEEESSETEDSGLQKPAIVTEELWSGTDEELAEGIQESLAENDIPNRVIEEADGRSRILVAKENLERAREILREIVEATPPE